MKKMLFLLFGLFPNLIQSQDIADVVKISNWLEATKNQIGIWPDNLSNSNKVTLSLGQGVAGKVLFYLELYRLTENIKYKEEALNGADYILSNLPKTFDSIEDAVWPYGLYSDICGGGMALSHAYSESKDDRYKIGVFQIIEFLNDKAVNKLDTISWDQGNDLLGGLAGTGLFLLNMGKKFSHEKAIEVAEEAGQTLLKRSIKDGIGMNWYFGQNRPFVLPNFSHGAAGIGFFLGSLYQETDNKTYLKATEQVDLYLNSIAVDTLSSGFLLPYAVPNLGWSTTFDIGWAHGPSGTARFFQQMYSLINDKYYLNKMEACLESLIIGGIPDNPNEIFGIAGESINYRFGMAGVAHLALDLYLITNNADYLIYAEEVIDFILNQAERSSDMLFWKTTLRDGSETAFTGYFYGAAGYGRLLIKLILAKNGNQLTCLLPDEIN